MLILSTVRQIHTQNSKPKAQSVTMVDKFTNNLNRKDVKNVKDDGLSRDLCGLCFLSYSGSVAFVAYGRIKEDDGYVR